MIRKQYITLIELLISLGLTMLLLTTLMGFYYQTTLTQKRVEESIQENFSALYSQFRLAKIIPTIQKFWVHDENSLVFYYDNGTGKGAPFSVEVLGKLMLMPSGDLMLFTWPTPERYPEQDPPMRQELLHQNIKQIRTRFLHPDEGVVEEWSDPQKLPLILWIDLIPKEGETIEYGFVLPEAGHPVLEVPLL